MGNDRKNLCIFTHFSKYSYILKYVNIYVTELSNYFDDVILVTNRRSLNPEIELNDNVSTLFVENEGYDFGMFYKTFNTINPFDYYQIACVNDSNLIFGELKPIFEWGSEQQVDFWGLVDSHEAPWFSTHADNYHIQSHFIIFNSKAITFLRSFFEALDIESIFREKDPIQLRRLVIDQWEIGLSQFLLSKGLTSASYCDSKALLTKYRSKGKNVTFKLHKELIKEGYPLIKKKVVMQRSWRSFLGLKEPWENVVNEYSIHKWNMSGVIAELHAITF